MKRSRQILALIPAGSALMLPTWSLAQPVSPDRPALNQPSGAFPSRFTKVEQTIADVDPLRTSTRTLQTDLRHPTDFRDVFQIRGSAHEAGHWGVANPTGGDLFARVHGAVTAVFPQSIYIAAEKGGVIPLVPPGTVFFIGQLPWERFGAGDVLLPPPDRVDSRVDMRADAPASTPAQATEVENPVPTIPTIRDGSRGTDESKADRPSPPPLHSASIMTDEPLRRRTVRDLIMKAAQPAPKVEAAPAATPKGATGTPAEPEKKTAPEKPERR